MTGLLGLLLFLLLFASSPKCCDGVGLKSNQGVGLAAKSKATLGKCKTCIYVVERLKNIEQFETSICTDVYQHSPDDYAFVCLQFCVKALCHFYCPFPPSMQCHTVLIELKSNKANARHWMKKGCWKYEKYENAKEWIQPCPSHVTCAVRCLIFSALFLPLLISPHLIATGLLVACAHSSLLDFLLLACRA